MFRTFSFLSALVLMVQFTITAAFAQTPVQANADVCTKEINKEVVLLHQMFRSVIFGRKKAEDSPIGNVVYLSDGSAWYKISNDTWRSLDEQYKNLPPYNDSRIDNNAYAPVRTGLLATKRVTTSEIIPYIGVSLRAFQCQLYQLCNAVQESKKLTENDDPQEISAVYPGCIPIQRTTIPECHINEEKPNTESVAIYNNCESAVQSILDHEAEILNLAVQYDAAYRSLLQLSGSIDLFLEELHWPMAHSLRDATDIITTLGRIPCFISSCEAFPPPAE